MKNKIIFAFVLLLLCLSVFATVEWRKKFSFGTIAPATAARSVFDWGQLTLEKAAAPVGGSKDKCAPIFTYIKVGANTYTENLTSENWGKQGLVRIEYNKGNEIQVKFKAKGTKVECPIYQYTFELWTEAPGTKKCVDSAQKCYTEKKIQLQSYKWDTQLNLSNEIIVVAPVKIDATTEVYSDGGGETALGSVLGIQDGQSKTVYLRIETYPEKVEEGKTPDKAKWLDSDALPINIYSGTPPATQPKTECNSIVECLAQIDKQFVGGLYK